jgi:hypothetical protein
MIAGMATPSHRTRDELERTLPAIRGAPGDRGVLELIVRRPAPDTREVVERADVDTAVGLRGDNWLDRGSRHTEDGSAELDRQLTLMNSRAAAAIAGGREHWPLAGDQLYVDLDLGSANLPAGSQVRIGDAVVEVSAAPHTGCAKFIRRFGREAARFVNSGAGRELNLRGINARVATPGEIRAGDPVVVTSRPSGTARA